MLGEHPSSLTELHAQKHQVNSPCKSQHHSVVVTSPKHPMHGQLLVIELKPKTSKTDLRNGRFEYYYLLLCCFYSRMTRCKYPSKSLPVKFKLQMQAATSLCLRRWGKPFTLRWRLWSPRMSPDPTFSSSSSMSCSCSIQTTYARERCIPYR